MKVNIFLFASILFLLLFSCSKEQNEEFDFLVFGHFYGECIGEQCVEIFKLTATELSEDTNDKYPGQSAFYNGNYELISSDKFDLVKDLPDLFPAEIWNENQTVIGQPDAGDWGGFYLEMKNSNGHEFWLLDKMKSNVPNDYHIFIDSLNAKIAQISN